MSALIYNNTQINYEVSEAYGKLFLNSDVALGYGIHQQTVKDHQKNNPDELIEGTHYIYDYAMTNGGRQRVIKWTTLGVYHLGFFIKSKQAKDFINQADRSELELEKWQDIKHNLKTVFKNGVERCNKQGWKPKASNTLLAQKNNN